MKPKQKYTGSQSDATTIPPTIIINITVKGNKNALNVLSPGAISTVQGDNCSYVSGSPRAKTKSGTLIKAGGNMSYVSGSPHGTAINASQAVANQNDELTRVKACYEDLLAQRRGTRRSIEKTNG